MFLTPPSNWVTLTEIVTGGTQTIRLQSALINRIDLQSDGSGATLSMLGMNGGTRLTKIDVSETPAAVAALTGIHVALTSYDNGAVMYLNVMNLRKQIVDQTTYRIVFFDHGGGGSPIRVTESAVAIQTAINAAIPSDAANVITVAVAGSVVGDATSVTGLVNGAENILVLTGADSVKGAVLPAATAGMAFDVVATGSGNNAFAYLYADPASDTISGGASYKISEGNSYRVVCYVTGAWVIASSTRNTLTVAVSGAGTGFRVQDNEHNTVIITGANGTDAIQLSTNASSNTTCLFVNAAGAVALVTPPAGGDFGFGVDVPLKVGAASTALLVGNSASGAFNTSHGSINVQGDVLLVEQANTGTTGLENGAVNTVNIVGGGTTLSSASPSKWTDRVPVEHYTTAVELSATPANNVYAAQTIIVSSVTAPTDVLVINSNLVNRVRVLNPLGLVFIVRFSSDTAVTFGSINGVASASYVVNASARVLDFEANGGYPGPYTAYSLLSCHGQGQFDGATGTDVIADIGIRATSSVMITRTSVPSAANVVSEFVTKAAGTGFTVTSYDAAYATVLTDAGTFDYYVRY